MQKRCKTSARLSIEQKREKAILHVQRRAFERLGVSLSIPEVKTLSAKCGAGELGELGLPGSGGVFHVMTRLRGHDVRLLYCPRLQLVVTIYQRPMGRKKGDSRLRAQVGQ